MEQVNEMYYNSLDDRELLIEKYRFTEEELVDIDIEKFSDYVDVRKDSESDFARHVYSARRCF